MKIIILLLMPIFCFSMDYDDLYTKEEAQEYHDNSRVQQHIALYFSKKITCRLNCSEATLLDIGCGPGNITSFLAKKAKWVHGIDRSHSMITLAREKYSKPNLTFERADIRTFIPKNKFDIVMAFNMLHQIDASELIAVFHSMKNCIKPGGLFILTVPPPSSKDEINLLRACFKETKIRNSTESPTTKFKLIHRKIIEDDYAYPDLKKMITFYETINWPTTHLEKEQDKIASMKAYLEFKKEKFEEYNTDQVIEYKDQFKKVVTTVIAGKINWLEIIVQKTTE